MNPRPSLAPAAKSAAPQVRTQVLPEDIGRLEAIHAVLDLLNDSHASALGLARLVAGFPPLEARIINRFRARFPKRDHAPLPQQIATLGNGELEAILLGLLEDLTVLHAELEER